MPAVPDLAVNTIWGEVDTSLVGYSKLALSKNILVGNARTPTPPSPRRPRDLTRAYFERDPGLRRHCGLLIRRDSALVDQMETVGKQGSWRLFYQDDEVTTRGFCFNEGGASALAAQERNTMNTDEIRSHG